MINKGDGVGDTQWRRDASHLYNNNDYHYTSKRITDWHFQLIGNRRPVSNTLMIKKGGQLVTTRGSPERLMNTLRIT